MWNDHAQRPSFGPAKIGPTLWTSERNCRCHAVGIDQAVVNYVKGPHFAKVLSIKFRIQICPVRKVPLTVKGLSRMQCFNVLTKWQQGIVMRIKLVNKTVVISIAKSGKSCGTLVEDVQRPRPGVDERTDLDISILPSIY